MTFAKDNKGQNLLSRIISAIYIYAYIEVPKEQWLGDEQVCMYAEMIRDYCSGVNIAKHGWISKLKLEGVENKEYRYMIIKRIKDRKWLETDKKDGKKFVFPVKLVRIVKALISDSEEVVYTIKL